MSNSLFNDVLLNIWENSASFDETKSSFKNWAAAIARYRSIDYLRRYRREPQQVSLEDTEIPREDEMLQKLIDQELSEELDRLLSCLKPEDRQLFLKLYVEEESITQVSRETGMEKSVIYNRISRGKKRLRQHVSAERGV